MNLNKYSVGDVILLSRVSSLDTIDCYIIDYIGFNHSRKAVVLLDMITLDKRVLQRFYHNDLIINYKVHGTSELVTLLFGRK